MPPESGDEGGIAKVDVSEVFELDLDAEKHFTGHAELWRLLPEDDLPRISRVCFGRGVQTRRHHHHGVQLLWFTKGRGEVSTQAKTLTCRPGDIVRVDPNVSHVHGAAANHIAEHLAFTVGSTFWEEDDR